LEGNGNQKTTKERAVLEHLSMILAWLLLCLPLWQLLALPRI